MYKRQALYSSNVLIMEKCEELLPDHFNFVRGVVAVSYTHLDVYKRQVREMATGMLIAQAMQDEDYAQAQELVDTLSDATPFADVYKRQQDLRTSRRRSSRWIR